MFRNYLNIALRSLKTQKTHSLINLAGLSIGIMACIVIVLFVRYESSYENFYPENENIYRVTTHYETGNRAEKIAITPSKVGNVAVTEIPETALATVVFDWRVGREILTKYKDKVFTETDVFFADSSFFKVFQHPFLDGNPETALDQPSSIVLTESTARKYFDRIDNVVGEVLNANGNDYQITGVIRDVPSNTELGFDFVISMATIGRQLNNSGWFPMNYFTYVTLNENARPEDFAKKLNAILEADAGEQLAASGTTIFYETQALTEMHLSTDMMADYPGKISKNLIFSLLAIAAFIMLIACINYINLSTAKSEKRAKEVGMRKVMGAHRKQLIFQFYGETTLVSLVAVILGVVLAELLLPMFNQLANVHLDIPYFSDPYFIPALAGFVILISLISGSYPASYLSGFKPVKVLKGTYQVRGGNLFRRVLVVVQFSVSVFLIVGTLIVYYQLNFIQSKDMGYESDEIVYMKLPDRRARNSYESMKGGFSTITGVESITYSNNLISDVKAGWTAFMEGLAPDETISFKGMNGDVDFLETFGFDLVAGAGYSDRSNWKEEVYYLVNETGIEALGLTAQEAIGKRFGIAEHLMGTIVGVVKDFHLNSLHNEIEPLAVYTGPENFRNLMFTRINMSRAESVLAEMEQVWEEFNPDRPFEPIFLNESIKDMYESEQRLGNIILTFTALAIGIGCLGLFGLASYLASKRTKEIGIRKVLGANVSGIVVMLSKDYIRIILISNFIGWPIAYFVMNRWLEVFAFRITIGWQFFLIAAVATVLVALISVSYQSLKAAVSNPIKALRYE